jgi:KaiC/GvpD/RAD55 family RecA-like ATPase
MIWKEGQLARSLVVEKMRCTNVKPAQHDFDIIKEQGIVLQNLP